MTNSKEIQEYHKLLRNKAKTMTARELLEDIFVKIHMNEIIDIAEKSNKISQTQIPEHPKFFRY